MSADQPNPPRSDSPGEPPLRSIRKRSSYEYLGMPLWSIALGPDLERGELRGHAKGVLAIGDIATGIVAFGGIARGFIALGGLAIGVFALGGLAVGGLALGGAGIGIVAGGGAAFGAVAMGGAAFGYYAAGSTAFGRYVLSPFERSPDAVALFAQWEWLRAVLPQKLWR
jgi:hypothetical protein